MEINIAYGVNEKYTKFAYISLLSILYNVDSKNIVNCYLITNKNNKYSKYIYNLEKYFNNFKFYEIEAHKSFKNIKNTLPHLDNSGYFRFQIDNLADKGIKKILYIDADTIITDDISRLFNENLEGNIVGVISEGPTKKIKELINRYSLSEGKYFNSGVMLIDVFKRREFKVSQKCLNLLNYNRYPNDDQEPLNIILQNKCKWLEGKYNTQQSYFLENEKRFQNIGFDKEYYYKAVDNPSIVHFTGTIKPRHLISIYPYTLEYDKTCIKSLKINGYGIIKLKEILIIVIHKIEFSLFPKYSTRRKIWNLISKIRRRISTLF